MSVSESGTESGAESESEPESGAESESESESGTEAEHESGSVTESETGSKPEPESGIESEPAPSSCLTAPVTLRRIGPERERVELRLTHCDGRPNLGALDGLSRIARAKGSDTQLVRLDSGLMPRLQRIAERWPGRELVVVSGHRPGARRGSRHRHGHAVDVSVEGVDDAQVVELLQELSETGIGYYPNSTFVHVDVRPDSAFWVDRSGPGEPPDYGPWPAGDGGVPGGPDDADLEALRERAMAALHDAFDSHGPELPVAELTPARELLAQLQETDGSAEPPQTAKTGAPADGHDELSQARSALQALNSTAESSAAPAPAPEELQRELEALSGRALLVMAEALAR
ncbi:MAG: DUF882 domain-containing protein [Myxococcales bacterium]